jgi:hypothetical protein
MKKRSKIDRWLVRAAVFTVILATTIALVWCSRGPVVTITNQSTVILSNIVLSGSGFTNRIDQIAPGGRQRLAVHWRGESGLRVVFEAGGRHVDSGEQGYFEAGYQVNATIDTNLTVSVSSNL